MWEWKLKYNIFYYHPNKMKHTNLTKCTPGLYAEDYKTLERNKIRHKYIWCSTVLID